MAAVVSAFLSFSATTRLTPASPVGRRSRLRAPVLARLTDERLDVLAELSIDARQDQLDELFEEVNELEALWSASQDELLASEAALRHSQSQVAQLESELKAAKADVKKLERLRHFTHVRVIRRGLNRAEGRAKDLAVEAQQKFASAKEHIKEHIVQASDGVQEATA